VRVLEAMGESEAACGLKFTDITKNSNLGTKITPDTVLPSRAYMEKLNELSGLTDAIYNGVKSLELAITEAKSNTDSYARAKAFETEVLPKMRAIRTAVDHAECITGSEAWPYPTYADLLFGVR
jgi:glutamine synthetase